MAESALTRPGQRDRYQNKFVQIDWMLCLMMSLIAGMGGLVLYSVGGMSWEPWAYDHIFRYGLFFVIMIGLSMVNLSVWLSLSYWIYGASLLLLIAVELFGKVKMGAQRWLDIGITDIQPSEFMKLAIVLALARWYHENSAKDANWSWKLLVPIFMIMMPFTLVAHQPDLGTAMLILITGVAVMIAAGLNWKAIATAVGAGVVAIPFVFTFVLHDYQAKRITTFLDPESDPSGSGYHILQSKIAMGSGGLLGKGLGLGSQSQLNFLPEKHTDFIMAAVSEELGFVGGASVFLLYGLVIFMALRIAMLSHSHFGRLAVAGTIATFAVYVLINGAMVMGLAPVVGVPMPLLSYGGSVMLTVMVAFGLVQGVKVHRYQELPRQNSIFARFE
ncbi:rod shape-determining protein RodA [Asticcacaulis machinosus]|uniref:Peptidoglycan glycosyltransferase MrdB n=1 Tax=Asticcacaulis machinosus TaxID=2984211 RepID=A0ABT5HNB0_9CAUL|nr:rod shape-determining protein RodA [Asticcacaulis machinosus]MDC7677652.1 rod shape-determining protein RodA [Asticcacaulis machinosus]